MCSIGHTDFIVGNVFYMNDIIFFFYQSVTYDCYIDISKIFKVAKY